MFEKYDSMKAELHDTKKDIKKTEDEIIAFAFFDLKINPLSLIITYKLSQNHCKIN